MQGRTYDDRPFAFAKKRKNREREKQRRTTGQHSTAHVYLLGLQLQARLLQPAGIIALHIGKFKRASNCGR